MRLIFKMEENKTIDLERVIRIKRRTMILDIILIIVLLAIAFYAYTNIEYIKQVDNPCKICEDKTGGKCLKFSGGSNPHDSNYQEINFSGIFNGTK
jgi:hypothetical protein